MKRLNNQELADLPTRWQNPTVDTSKYYQTVGAAWEIDEAKYNDLNKKGCLVMKFNGKFYCGN